MTIPTALPIINPLYRRPIVEQSTGDSRSTIYRKIQRGLLDLLEEHCAVIESEKLLCAVNAIKGTFTSTILNPLEKVLEDFPYEAEAAR